MKEDNANHVAEINFYQDILDDLEKDKQKINGIREFNKHSIEMVTWLLEDVRNPALPLNLVEFGIHVEPLYYNETTISFNASFEASKSTGTFNGFINKVLYKELIQYYSEFSQIESVNNSTLRFLENHFEPLMSKHVKNYLSDTSAMMVMAQESNHFFYEHLKSIEDKRNRNPEPEIKELLQSPEFESFLIGDLGRSFNSIAKLENRFSQAEIIQSQIKEFLEN